jgi:F420H(2)-dependent quinone reductase
MEALIAGLHSPALDGGRAPREDSVMAEAESAKRPPWLPPRWFVRLAWRVHRALYSIRGRKALRPATPTRWGMFRITTVGRKTGVERKAILGYLDDGPNLVTMAMNGWANPEPKWWLNLQANPDATLEMFDGTRREVTAHAATGEERERLWALWNTLDEDYEGYTKLRSRETAIVVLEPRTGQASGAANG